MIRAAFPDASVEVNDLAGDGNHYAANVVSAAFKGESRSSSTRWSTARSRAMGGELHALALTTAAG